MGTRASALMLVDHGAINAACVDHSALRVCMQATVAYIEVVCTICQLHYCMVMGPCTPCMQAMVARMVVCFHACHYMHGDGSTHAVHAGLGRT